MVSGPPGHSYTAFPSLLFGYRSMQVGRPVAGRVYAGYEVRINSDYRYKCLIINELLRLR